MVCLCSTLTKNIFANGRGAVNHHGGEGRFIPVQQTEEDGDATLYRMRFKLLSLGDVIVDIGWVLSN
ncbi:hypothetical protein DSCOOX_16530 [Desulfosarcina ovata subsp. ovata]|uniref:Uncharacterized protein n=1 Tax=Desulfosarcina ovata subsp. ovata TaxID=2752305 RepID=A0A5K8A766_9BACT|nr:hypothetical protein DSCOOX_16530 [Desulfosarcina ovata subsp. ovata]